MKNIKRITNRWDVPIDYEAAVELMDNDLREELHNEIAPCSAQEFFDTYAERHKAKFGDEWELDKANPVY